VFKRQVDHVRPDGTKSRAMGFRVCTIDDWVDDSAAAVLAQALNHSTRLTFAALREANQARAP